MRGVLSAGAAIAASIVLAAMPAQAEEIQSTPIEPSAIISDEMIPALLDALAVLAKLYGYECDSISAASPLPTGDGFSLSCNNRRYSCKIGRRGDWVVAID